MSRHADNLGLGPVLIGLQGLEPTPAELEFLTHPMVGGVVLFSRNYRDRKQLASLIAHIQAARSSRLLIAIDQEGGRVQRLVEDFTRLPALGTIGEMAEEDLERAMDMAYRHARVMATEMLAVGIDLSFAPVLDLDRGSRVIGDRSFGADPQRVVQLGRAYLAGMHDSGMKTTGKHFPGHGSIVADSHVDHVCDERGLEDICSSDMSTFVALKNDLDAVMIAHVLYSAVDGRPAGYSPRWLQQVLREDIGFTGVAISDDLGMHAATVAGSVAERVNLCLAAGCDIALVCLPDDVRTLMDELPANAVDASEKIGGLYGQATIKADELGQLDQEGIREWAHWQNSLNQLRETTV